MNHFEGKKVVVTGAGGSIGSRLCREIVEAAAAELTLFSLTESGLYNVTRMLRGLGSQTKLVPVLGSVTNDGLVLSVLDGKDIVIHAAAHKHVPICEDNPVEAVANNVFGTQTLIRCAIYAHVQQFMLISSDKAVRPVSVMGATKRVCELLVMKAASERNDTVFSAVRFGNVLGSAGSVLPLWREQLAEGKVITVTDRRCTRYFMSIPEACELVLGALRMQCSGLFAFDMGKPKNIYRMACELVLQAGKDPEDSIELIGLRPGEKLVEEIAHGGRRVPTEHPKIFEVVEESPCLPVLHLLPDLEQYVKARAERHVIEALMSIVV